MPPEERYEEQIRDAVWRELLLTGDSFLQWLFPAPQKTTPLAELAKNPTILSILIDLFKEGPFPQNPGVLLRHVTARLWQSHIQQGFTPYEQAEAAFAQLAFAMLDLETPDGVPIDYAIDKIGQVLVDQGLQVGYLMRSGQQIGFAHALIRDYFAACHAQHIDFAVRLQPPKFRRWSPSSREGTLWDGAMIALSGIGDGDAVIAQIAKVDPILAQLCATSGANLSVQSYRYIADQLRPLLLGDSGEEAQEVAAAALGQLGPRVTEYLLDIVSHPQWQVRASVAEALGHTRDLEARPHLIELLFHDPDHRVQAAAAAALGYVGGAAATQALLEKLDEMAPPVGEAADEEVTCTVLVVNDSIDALTLMGMMLERSGLFSVLLAHNGREGIAQFTQNKPTAVFMNRMMPDMDGYEATRIIFTQSPRTPVVMASASALLKPSIWSGATDLLSLPILSHDIVGMARTICWKYFNPQHNVIKQAVALALGNIGTTEGIQPLKTLLTDEHVTLRVRHHAQIALANMQGAAAFEVLFDFWNDRHPQMGWDDVFEMLKKMNPGRLKQSLLAASYDDNPAIGRTAVDHLRRLELDGTDGQTLVNHPHAEARVLGVQTLANLKDMVFLPSIVQALYDQDPSVRIAAVQGVNQVRDERALIALHEALRDPMAAVRKEAAGALRDTPDPASVPFLLKALSDENGDVRREAIYTLGYFRDDRAKLALLRALDDEEVSVREAAAIALRNFGDSTVADVLQQRLKDRSPKVRKETALTLGVLQAVDAAPRLVELLKDDNQEVRRNAAQALGKIGDAAAVPALLEVLTKSDEDIERKDNIEALGHCVKPGDLPQVLDLLISVRGSEVQDVIRVVSKIADASAVPALLAVLPRFQHSYHVVQLAEMLVSLDAEAAAPTLIDRLPELDRWDAQKIANLIIDTAPRTALPRLIAALRNPEYGDLSVLIGALGNARADDLVPALIEQLAAPKNYVAQRAAETLGKMGDARAIPALLEVLHHEDRWVRYHAAQALGDLRYPAAVDGLAAALRDPDSFVSEGAARALRQIDTKEALVALERWKKQSFGESSD